MKRGNPPGEGSWALPGGGIELGETISEAVEREVKEETDLTVKAGRILTAVDAIYSDSQNVSSLSVFARKTPEFHYVIIYLEALYVSGSLCASDDAQDARWVSYDELKDLLCEPAVKRLCESFYN